MSDEPKSLSQDVLQNLDNLLFQCAHQTRKLSQRKNEINHQIKAYRDKIATANSSIETIKTNIKSVDDDIKSKQNSLTQNKVAAKSAKSINGLLLQYEQTLKADLESREARYNHEREEFKKRIASYRASFQSYEEYYYNNPLAQKLLGLQAENRKIEASIKSHDEQITTKQMKLDNLSAPVIQPSVPENLLEGVPEQLPDNEPEEQPQMEAVEESHKSFKPASENLFPSDEFSGKCIEELQNSSTFCLPAEEGDAGSVQQNEDQHAQEETEIEEEDNTAGPQDPPSGLQNPSMEGQITVLEMEQAMELEMDEGLAVDPPTTQEAPLSQTSPQTPSPQVFPVASNSEFATPTFPFTFSPGISPHPSDPSKSPFALNIHSEASTPGFFAFGAQDEDQSSPFTSSFFGNKKTEETKTSMEFLFNPSEPSGEFQLSFNNKSDGTKGGSSKDDFPFSFKF